MSLIASTPLSIGSRELVDVEQVVNVDSESPRQSLNYIRQCVQVVVFFLCCSHRLYLRSVPRVSGEAILLGHGIKTEPRTCNPWYVTMPVYACSNFHCGISALPSKTIFYSYGECKMHTLYFEFEC